MESLSIDNQNLIKQYFSPRELSVTTKKKYLVYFKKFEELLEHEIDIDSNSIGGNIETIIKIADREYANKRMKSEYIKQFLLLLNCLNKSVSLSNTIKKYSKLTNSHYSNKRQIAETGIVSVPTLLSLLKHSDVTDTDYCLFFLLLNYGLCPDDLVINVTNTDGNYMYCQPQIKDKNKIASVKIVLDIRTITIKSRRFIDTIKNHTKPTLFEFGDNQNISEYIDSRVKQYLKSDEYICDKFIYDLLVNYYTEHNKYAKLSKLQRPEE